MSRFQQTTFLFAGLLVVSSLIATTYPPILPDSDQNIAQKIYDKLQEVIGDKEARWPKLVVWSVENRGAIFVPGDNSIYLDEKLIISCKSFGAQMEDALSFVIAHEMTHFYQSHQWKESGLVHNFMVSSEAFNVNRQYEAQADIYGAFISYQAGYNSLRLIPDLLDRIYEAYRLETEANDQYPSLQQRKELALESCELAGNLIEIYHMANYLVALGRFEAAYHLYQYVVQNIQFKELHYNIGISNMMAYLHLQQIGQKYPLLIDSRSPIQRGLIDRSPQDLLHEALVSFERITEKYDTNYWPAKIHLISILDWSGDIQRAQELIYLFDGISAVKDNAQYLLTKANFYARHGETKKSKSLYHSMLDSSRPDLVCYKELIEYNLATLLEETPQRPDHQNHPIKNEKELDGVSSLVLYRDFQHSITIHADLLFRSGQEYNSIVSKLEFGRSRFTMQRITTADVGISGSLGVGHTLMEIEDHFSKERLTTWQDVHGSYVIVFARGLIFRLNEKRIIEEWISFSI